MRTTVKARYKTVKTSTYKTVTDSQLGTHETVKARFLPWIAGQILRILQGVPSLRKRGWHAARVSSAASRPPDTGDKTVKARFCDI